MALPKQTYIVATVLFCGFVGIVALGAEPATATSPDVDNMTLERLAIINQQNLAALRCYRLSETVNEWTYRAPTSELRTQQRMLGSRGTDLQERVAAAAAGNADATQVKDLQDELRRRDPAVANSVLIRRLNRVCETARVTLFDVPGHRIRRESRDLRDLDALCTAHGLTKYDRFALDQTQLKLVSDEATITMRPNADKLATVMHGLCAPWEHECCYFGIAPAWVFDAEYAPTLRRMADSTRWEVIGTKDGALFYIAVFDAALGWRLTQYSTLHEGVAQQVFEARRFEDVAGTPLPRETAYHHVLGTFGDFHHEHRVVTSAEVIKEPGPQNFALPPDCRVQEFPGQACPPPPESPKSDIEH